MQDIQPRPIRNLDLAFKSGLIVDDTYLTLQQARVLRLIGLGINTKRIAALLKVSPKTVEYHRSKLMQVTGRRTVAGLTMLAVKGGLVALK